MKEDTHILKIYRKNRLELLTTDEMIRLQELLNGHEYEVT